MDSGKAVSMQDWNGSELEAQYEGSTGYQVAQSVELLDSNDSPAAA